MAPFWGGLLVLTSLAATGSFSSRHLFWAAVLLIAAQFGWLYLSGRWYTRRYGVVTEADPALPSGLTSIMHPEAGPQRASSRRYGYLSDLNAFLFLIWALTIVPDIFLGRHAQPGILAMLIAAYQIFPRCLYSAAGNWSIVLRRILAVAALIAVVGIYIEYRFGRIDLWTWMALLLSLLLLLDLYDHWLLSRLLNTDFTEPRHE
jgi:hypothetical protein